MSKVITASGNTVEGYWPGLFAKALQGQDITKLLSNVGTGAGAPSGQDTAVANKDDDGAAKPKEGDNEEPPVEDDVDMVGLFDDDY